MIKLDKRKHHANEHNCIALASVQMKSNQLVITIQMNGDIDYVVYDNNDCSAYHSLLQCGIE